MAARDEILAELRKHTAGLTSAELAPLCPAADYDQFIVARVIAQLRQEKLVTGAPSGPRDGRTVFILNGPDASTPTSAPLPKPSAPPTTETKETPMSTVAKILAAIEQHGPMTVTELAKHVRADNLSGACYALTHDKRLAIDKSGGRGKYVYSLPGAAPARSRATPQAPRESTRRPATPRANAPANGGGAEADFAITKLGLLSIVKDGQVVQLSPVEYAELRTFTERAEAIWKETL